MAFGYKDSKFYDRQREVVELWENGSITPSDRDERILKALEHELRHPELYGTWLLSHFNSTAEFMNENVYWIEDYFNQFGEDPLASMVEVANREIEIFEKYAVESKYGRFMAGVLQEALGRLRERGFEVA